MPLNNFELLRRYEPILRFTKGEFFFPCDINSYLKHASLWMRHNKAAPSLLVPEGELDADVLAQYRAIQHDTSMYVQFVDEPLQGAAYRRWLRDRDRPRFKAPGRLARVGLVSRLVDSAFDLTLSLRGKVPGGTVAAAAVKYQHMQAEDPRYVYYGRVLREGGYIILHYLFFYAMNNWRTTYYGVNDHEADWEQVFVYLAEEDGADPSPEWVAYASHDYVGDDLRRRWDDPELHRSGTHPIVYVGAGSHASYFLPGEYLMRIEISFARPLLEALWRLQEVWSERLGQGKPTESERRQISNLLSLPFVDYARGDGLSVGPRQMVDWSPVIVSDDVPWVDHYRGLWGLDTRDPLRGENAPAGPKYNRDGTVRASWSNPLGWAGLHKVPPPQQMPRVLDKRITELQAELAEVETDINRLRRDLPKLNLEVLALQPHNHLADVYESQTEQLEANEATLNALYRRRTTLQDALQAARQHIAKLEAGQRGDPQAHVHHKHTPQTPSEIEANVLLESWAALSAGLLLLGFALLLSFYPAQWFLGLGALTGLYAVIEASLRRRLQELLLSISVILAVVTSGVLLYEFFWETLGLLVVGVAVMIIVTNWRELHGT